jgi:DNA invertase Pin-like site-specific DNA recombinase
MSKPVTSEQKADIVRLYQEGKSAREVGSALSISHQTVLNVCREAGIDIRAPHVSNIPSITE